MHPSPRARSRAPPRARRRCSRGPTSSASASGSATPPTRRSPPSRRSSSRSRAATGSRPPSSSTTSWRRRRSSSSSTRSGSRASRTSSASRACPTRRRAPSSSGSSALLALPRRRPVVAAGALGRARRSRPARSATRSARFTIDAEDARRRRSTRSARAGGSSTTAGPTTRPGCSRSSRGASARPSSRRRSGTCSSRTSASATARSTRACGRTRRRVFRNAYLSFEAMRGHLCGPERRGELDVEEDDDKVVIEFDPCGSGGRMQRGDLVEGTGPRAEEPYNLGVTTREARLGVERGGRLLLLRPLLLRARAVAGRAVGPPGARRRLAALPATRRAGPSRRSAAGRSTRALEAIPAEAYERIGLKKPE